ncbi:MAG: hypothetical protein AMS21_10015 [Gemmatimonas sp. SG8_38_2]|nr:MAG: hypothetical protein AMS21_10015 [Gemmatimonas sp. SG8_38_2]
MFRRLILLFILVPIAELVLLIQLGRWVGLWPTLALIVVTGTVGAALASREGLRAWHAFQDDLANGRMPGRPIMDGLSIFSGGALLLTPGLMTDILGFVLVARPTRRWVQNRIVNRFGGRLLKQGQVFVQTSAGWGRSPGKPETGEPARPTGREIEREDHP